MNGNNKCVDCGKIICLVSKRCKSCSNINRAGQPHNLNQYGSKNPNWKGNKISNIGVHQWIKKRKPKSEVCKRCGLRLKLELSNNSGNYLRDINDYEWLCKPCHHKKDGIDVAFLKSAKRDKRGKLNPNWKNGIYSDIAQYRKQYYQKNKEIIKENSKRNYIKRCEKLQVEIH